MTESYKKRLSEYGEELRKILGENHPIDNISEDWLFLWRLVGYIEGLNAEKEKKEGLQCKKKLI